MVLLLLSCVPFIFISGIEAGYTAVNVTRQGTAILGTLLSQDVGAISPLLLNITSETASRLRIRITDATNPRYEVPYPPVASYTTVDRNVPLYKIEVRNKPFAIWVTRTADNTVVLDTRSHELAYAPQFLSLGTRLPSSTLYGIGEDAGPLLRSLDNKRHVLWNNGNYQSGEGLNLYGSHPFYINLEHSGKANGVLLLNSNAMEILLTKEPGPALTWITIGGILDISIFIGQGPIDVVRQYTERIGRPFLPPIWSLGFQLCRWGYNNTGYMRSVLDDMVDQHIPVDVQWNDIDYMHTTQDFTISEEFSGLPAHNAYLHKLGKRHVVMLDPAIFVNRSGGYLPFQSGLEDDVFIKNVSNELLIGKVWPGDTAFPDFLFEKTVEWWTYWISHLNKILDFDGLWIDMNEPQSFYDGSAAGCPWNSDIENPPYYPGVRGRLQWTTLCLTAKQHHYLHYDVHNLYGWSEAHATHRALKALRPTNRTFILSRSTFVGSGRWAAHWTGDVLSTWADLATSIPGLLNMNMFGIPMVGADICGFQGSSNLELCVRWSQLGAFYPFSRNHNTLFARPQEPTAWGTEVTAIIRAALRQRYRLILYLYELFVKAHESGDPVMQALFMQFPHETTTHDKDRQFMWGRAVMICPALVEGARTTWIYFPGAIWYDLWTMEKVSAGQEVVEEYPAPLQTINVFGRGGSIIPLVWETEDVPTAQTVLYSQDISLYCYLDGAGAAEGRLFVDDGFSDLEERPMHRAQFSIQNRVLSVSPLTTGSDLFVRRITTLRVGGVTEQVVAVYVDDTRVDFHYHSEVQALEVKELSVSTATQATIRWQFADEA